MIDLHAHTTASDGTLSPTELVKKAAQIGLTYLAITDHDTVAAIDEARPVCRAHGITLIPAIEMSTEYDGRSVDMLGYGIDPAYRPLLTSLDDTVKERRQRIDEMVAKLRAAGYPIDIEAVRRISGDGVPGRPHIARALVEMGVVDSVREAFQKYVGKGKLAYVRKNNVPTERAISLINEAGGIAVLAHPIFLEMDDSHFSPLIDAFIEAGLGGLEVFYSRHTADDIDRFRRIAEEKGLIMTGGSDFHGESKPHIRLGEGPGGMTLDETVATNLLSAIARHRSAQKKRPDVPVGSNDRQANHH